MKTKFKLIAVLLFLTTISFNSQAQIKGGIGIVYGTKTGVDESGEKGQFGISPSLEYMFTDAISGGISYDFYFPSKIDFLGTEIKANIGVLNLDGRFYFLKDGPQVYALVGLGVAFAKVEAGSITEKDSSTGLNLGAGATFPLSDAMGINVQAKYQTFEGGNLAINAGLAFSF